MTIFPMKATVLQQIILQSRAGQTVCEGYVVPGVPPVEVVTWAGRIFRHRIANVYVECTVSPLLSPDGQPVECTSSGQEMLR